jgi:hypothetical protein
VTFREGDLTLVGKRKFILFLNYVTYVYRANDSGLSKNGADSSDVNDI